MLFSRWNSPIRCPYPRKRSSIPMGASNENDLLPFFNHHLPLHQRHLQHLFRSSLQSLLTGIVVLRSPPSNSSEPASRTQHLPPVDLPFSFFEPPSLQNDVSEPFLPRLSRSEYLCELRLVVDPVGSGWSWVREGGEEERGRGRGERLDASIVEEGRSALERQGGRVEVNW